MVKVVGVRFRNAGKIYYFGPGKLDIHAGMHVIVETARGVEMGTVMTEPKGVSEEEVIQPLKPVIRIATEADEKTVAKNREKEKDAFRICLEKIAKHKLDMKLVEAEYTFDNNKLLFYFTADGRIDFRELVKDLAAVFRTRIELRQIGVRDETKIMGGIGICGRALCCNTYLSEFAPVSIKMAKEQKVLVEVDDEKELREYPVDELKFRPRRRKENIKLSAKELKELSALEDKGGKSKIDDTK